MMMASNGLTYCVIFVFTGVSGSVHAAEDSLLGLSAEEKTDNTDTLSCLVFSNSGRQLAAGYGRCIGLLQKPRPGVAAVWTLDTRLRPMIIGGQTDGISAVAFSPDDRFVASGGCDGRIKLWDLSAGREHRTIVCPTGLLNGLAFSPNGRTLAAAFAGDSDDSTTEQYGVMLWNLAGARETVRLLGHGHGSTAVAFFTDGKWLASGGDDGTVIVWDLMAHRRIKTLAWSRQQPEVLAYIESLALYPDRRRLGIGRVRLGAGTSTAEFIVWDPENGTQKKVLDGIKASGVQFAHSPDGSVVVSATAETVSVWESKSGRLVTTINGHRPASFSRDGTRLAVGAREGQIRVIDVSRLIPAEMRSKRGRS